MARHASLPDVVRRALSDCEPPVRDIVAAVSGGPDSVAMLRAVVEVVPGRVVVAHVNHGLRGAESDADEEFVRVLVAGLTAAAPNVSFQHQRLNWNDGRSRGNVEARARRQRYDWFTQVAQVSGIPWVATAHTADDQAETVLFHLLRGSGLDGLRGIAARRELAPQCNLIRPILSMTRDDVEGYLKAVGQDCRIDETNCDRRFTRNRIRHELIPRLIRDYNPRVREILCGLARQAGEWRREIIADATAHLLRVEKPRAGALVILDSAAIETIARPLLREVWRLLWAREAWPRHKMGRREWDRLAGLCRGEWVALDLPGGIRARRRGSVIQIGPTEGGSNV